jgi:hypothetical protein
VREGPDCPRRLSDRHGLDRVPASLAPQLVVPHQQFQPEGDRFGVDPVRAADHDGLLVLDCARLDDFAQISHAEQQQLAGFLDLARERGVEQVR